MFISKPEQALTMLIYAAVGVSLSYLAGAWAFPKLGVGGDLYSFTPASFDLNNDDLLGYDLKFVKSGFKKFEVHAGPSTILTVAFELLMPSFIANLFEKSDTQKAYDSLHSKKVDILDARKRNLDFNQTGFTLMKVESLPSINWESEDAIPKFEEMIKPYLLQLYPNATRFSYTSAIHRAGGNSITKSVQKRLVDVPHADVAPHDEEWLEFHEKYPHIHEGQMVKRVLLGKDDTEEDAFGAILGLWFPSRMSTPVCDRPLVVMDASSGTPSDTTTMETHTHAPGRFTHHLGSLINYNPDQRWYYYSLQQSDEVLAFHQYSRDKSMWANPHTGIYNSQCGDEFETRSSTEFRVAVFFPKTA